MLQQLHYITYYIVLHIASQINLVYILFFFISEYLNILWNS